MSVKDSKYSRRQFVKFSAFGAMGLWAGFSDQLAARTVRGLMAETGRPVAKPQAAPTPALWHSNAITAAWLGHATVLINFYGVTILTDPALFQRVGARTFLGTIGAKRLVAPALTIKQLPPIDLVLLSHAHMDHLDLPTLKCFPASTRAVTAFATCDLLAGTKLKTATELRWGDKTRVKTRNGDLEIRAFEVRHWGARWKLDKHRGYNGYVLAREGRKIIFGGDTALSENFRSLHGDGPYDLAIMPIGSYKPWIWSHCTPEQAARMANDAGADHLLPIHFKTFVFGREGPTEPLERLEAAMEAERIALRDVGETFTLG